MQVKALLNLLLEIGTKRLLLNSKQERNKIMETQKTQSPYTHDELIERLREEDYPETMLEGVCKKLLSLTPEAQVLFDEWYKSGIIKDNAFDIAGITPLAIRMKEPKIKNVAIVIAYDHFIRLVKNEFAFILGNDKEKQSTARSLALSLMKHKKDKMCQK